MNKYILKDIPTLSKIYKYLNASQRKQVKAILLTNKKAENFSAYIFNDTKKTS